MKINERIGQNMQIARKKAGLTQKETADKLDVTAITLSRWETGTRQPSFERLEEFAKIVGRLIYGFFRDNTKRRARRFRKYAHEQGLNGYRIRELGVKDSDPFPKLAIPIDPQSVEDALNEAFYQGYKQMAETLHEITKGVLDG